MPDEELRLPRTWSQKFRDAFRGLVRGVQGQQSFVVHFIASGVVVACGAALRISLVEWYVLIVCITLVLTTEMFNSALESMAKAITGQQHPHLGDALDISSAAVLVASIGASLVGAILFTRRLGVLLHWWS
jgi:diacylglycerol kinase